jgi:hypothetical protein
MPKLSESDEEFLSLPGYVPTDIAAQRLGLTVRRVYQYLKAGELTSRIFRGRHMISEEELEAFVYKRHPAGRKRVEAAAWHHYGSGVRVLDMLIQVQVRTGQTKSFRQRLQAWSEEHERAFSGSMTRLVRYDENAPESVMIILVWKSNEMPGEETRQQELAAFQHDFADLLDWDTAHISHGRVLLTT